MHRDSDERLDDSPAARYIRDNFQPTDRLAVVAVNKQSGAVIQRLAPAEKIAAPDTQAWLRYMNDEGKYEIYVSMNALRDDARGRTKADVSNIRHVFLDLDHGGEEALQRLMERSDLPRPNYILNTSPGRYQVIWKVVGFTQEQAETLQRGLSREIGADVAVTDSSRVLRLPGFYNHKYAEPHLVEAKKLSDQTYRPEHFPKPPELSRGEEIPAHKIGASPPGRQRLGRPISQSERDWAYARRALSRGESKEAVISAIAEYRKGSKPRPQYYAQLTVRKAGRSLEIEKHAPWVEHPTPRR